jgi:hypothetical protein
MIMYLVFSAFTSRPTSQHVNRAPVFFYVIYIFFNMIQHRAKLMCPIQFQTHFVFLDLPNGVSRSKVEKYIVIKHLLVS